MFARGDKSDYDSTPLNPRPFGPPPISILLALIRGQTAGASRFDVVSHAD